MTIEALCTAEGGCPNRVKARGLCDMHYARQRRNGTLARKNRQYDRGVPRPNAQGYMIVYRPEQPNANKSGIVLVHRLVMSDHLGRPLRADETVHHKNGDRADNGLKNLELRRAFHGKGQSVDDLVAESVELLRLYAPELLAERRLRRVA